jgi:hypothetical protein
MYGKENSVIHMKLTLSPDAAWLIAVPMYEKSGWTGVLTNRNTVLSGRKEYPFFYYDYRMSDHALQDEEGFCCDQKELVPRIAQSLERAGFIEKEVKDFYLYWSKKIPSSVRYCVYPQGNVILKQIANLEVQPQARSIHRIIFVITTSETRTGSKNFSKQPVRPWIPEPQPKLESSLAQEGVDIREWGIAFLGHP